MDRECLATAYQLIAELLLHPDDRNTTRIAALRQRLGAAPPLSLASIEKFFAHPSADLRDEYVRTLELSPPCPLYLGAYLFDEPTTCRGVGTSPRNAYMLELVGIYRHFGFDLAGRELPDYVPTVLEFLSLSLQHPERDRIGLRRRLVEHYVRPALAPLLAALNKYESPYALLVESLKHVVEEDIRDMGSVPAWRPPESSPERQGRRLRVLTENGRLSSEPVEVQP